MDYRKPSKQKANETYLKTLSPVAESSPYNEESIDQTKKFLIICEGENTEPLYFENFPVPSKTVIIEGGKGSRTALVDYAIKIKDDPDYAGREVWCVYDFDVKPDEAATQPQDFNQSIIKAAQYGMFVAWSNDAFELWFLLHYQKMDAALTREEIYSILKKKWNLESYSNMAKKDEFCRGHYDRHGGTESDEQKLAIRRAKDLHEAFGDRQDYANQVPCTTVYLLVQELNKYIKE